MARSFSDFTARQRRPQLRDYVALAKPDPNGTRYRPVGDLFVTGVHWYGLKLSKPAKDGRMEINKSLDCWNYDSETDKMVDRGCPCCADGMQLTKSMHINVINRKLQNNPPRNMPPHDRAEQKLLKKHGFEFYPKKVGTSSWTPVEVLPVGSTQLGQLQKIEQSNTAKKDGVEKVYPVGHLDFGRDITASDGGKNLAPAQRFFTQKEERTPLTDEEMDLLYFDMDVMPKMPLAEVISEYKRDKPNIAEKRDDRDGGRGGRGGGRDGDIDERDSRDNRRSDDRDDQRSGRDEPRGRSRDDDRGTARRDEREEPRSRSRDEDDRGGRSREPDAESARRREEDDGTGDRGRNRDREPEREEPRSRGRDDREEPRSRSRDDERDAPAPAPRSRSRDDNDLEGGSREAPRRDDRSDDRGGDRGDSRRRDRDDR